MKFCCTKVNTFVTKDVSECSVNCESFQHLGDTCAVWNYFSSGGTCEYYNAKPFFYTLPDIDAITGPKSCKVL